MKEIDIEFLRLTTDICYIIGGYFGGKIPDDEAYAFMQDYGETVWLDMDQKMIFITHDLPRLQSFALEKVASDHGLGIDLYYEDEE
jgi:hypothetical protein